MQFQIISYKRLGNEACSHKISIFLVNALSNYIKYKPLLWLDVVVAILLEKKSVVDTPQESVQGAFSVISVHYSSVQWSLRNSTCRLISLLVFKKRIIYANRIFLQTK